MEEIHKRALRRCQPQLVDKIILVELLDELIGADVFTDGMIESIKAGNDRREQIQRLLSDLPRRGKETYNKFIACLKKTKQEHLADVIVEQEQQLRRDGKDQYAMDGNGKPGYPQTDGGGMASCSKYGIVKKNPVTVVSTQRNKGITLSAGLSAKQILGSLNINLGMCKNIQVGDNNTMIVNNSQPEPANKIVDTEVDSNEQETEQLPIMNSVRYIEDKDMLTVSSNIGLSWKRLMRNLDVDDETMDEIFALKKNNGITEVTYQCLIVWKENLGHRATIGALANALSEIGQNNLVRKLQEDEV